MLEELTVQNYALIDRATVKFGHGFNVLTGETGAGKSILIGALGLLLGAKGEPESIRTGSEESVVTGVVQVGENPQAMAWLKEHAIEVEEGTVIIRRVMKKSGRGSLFIQSTPATRADLEALTSFLFDVHGQHEHQSLLDSENQRMLLDRFGGTEALDARLFEDFQALSTVKKRYEKMLSSERTQLREMDILSFALKEIEEAALRVGEEEELEQEKLILSQHERLFTLLESFYENTAESKGGSLSSLREARAAMEGIIAINPELASFAKRLEDAFFEVEDVAEEVRRYQLGIQFRPDRLEECETRLGLIHRLEKKYGDSIEEVLKYAAESREQLESMETWQEDKEELQREIAERERGVLLLAQQLSGQRKAAAERLTGQVQERLRALGMPKGLFSVSLRQRLSEEGKPTCGPHGIDQIELMISANPGEPPKPLRSIASGGELSRIMLAIKSTIAESDQIGSLIFDEIDTGIGGEVAVAVGEHLQELARQKQVLCVTHLATIAARADNHLKVEKFVKDNRTFTGVETVSDGARVKEIARMLSGDSVGEVSLTHAQEMLRKYGRTTKGR